MTHLPQTLTKGQLTMSSPYPPQPPPRKFERSRSNKVLGGVCAGLATYLNMDVNLVRVLTVVRLVVHRLPGRALHRRVVPGSRGAAGAVRGTGDRARPDLGHGAGPGTGSALDPVWGSSGAPWDQTSSPAGPPTGPPPVRRHEPEPGPSPAPEASPSPESPATRRAGRAPAWPIRNPSPRRRPRSRRLRRPAVGSRHRPNRSRAHRRAGARPRPAPRVRKATSRPELDPSRPAGATPTRWCRAACW